MFRAKHSSVKNQPNNIEKILYRGAAAPKNIDSVDFLRSLLTRNTYKICTKKKRFKVYKDGSCNFTGPSLKNSRTKSYCINCDSKNSGPY